MSERRSSEAGRERIVSLVAARTGLAFAPSRREDAAAGIRRGMSQAGLEEASDYLDLLRRDAAAFDALVAELTVQETYFFRDRSHFDFIRRDAVPDLLGRRGPAHALRIWSAACSTGEEAYSLAIAMDEAGLLDRSQISGSDISRPALASAEAACYSPWALRGVDEGVLRRYFRSSQGRHRLDPRIQRAVRFLHLNLAQDGYPSVESGIQELDLILCRNVLIYFDRKTVEEVAERLRRSLAPGGWLLTGPSDPPLSEYADLQAVVTQGGVFYRRPIRPRRAEPFARWEPERDPTGSSLEREATAAPAELQPPVEADSEAALHVPARAPAIDALPEADLEEERDPSSGAPAIDPLPEARRALDAGGYERVLELTSRDESAEAAAIAIRARANRDGNQAAIAFAARATLRHSLSPELRYLHAVLLLDAGRLDEATEELRRLLYLDGSLPMAHFLLGMMLSRRGERDAALRSFAAAARLAEARPPEEPVRLGEGERAGSLANAARIQQRLHRERAPRWSS